MWQAYYTYYYNDGNKPQVQFAGTPGSNLGTKLAGGGVQATATLADYNSRNQYNPSITGNADWGYVGEGSKLSSNGFNSVKIPFFKSITVFGFNQHNFSAYTLINPVITRFGHDTYNYAEGNGTMENQMTLDYETVVYNTGALSGKSPSSIVTGFGEQANYDTTTSPIAKPGSNQTILGQGGLVDGASGVINGLEQGGISGFLGAAVAAGTTYNTFKNANLKTIAQSEVTTAIVNNGINGFPNRNLNVLTPIFGSTPSTSGTGGSQGQSAPTPVGPNNAGKQTGS